jgi:hypothetical protein
MTPLCWASSAPWPLEVHERQVHAEVQQRDSAGTSNLAAGYMSQQSLPPPPKKGLQVM